MHLITIHDCFLRLSLSNKFTVSEIKARSIVQFCKWCNGKQTKSLPVDIEKIFNLRTGTINDSNNETVISSVEISRLFEN